MLTQTHVDILYQALDALEKINKRAMNNSKAPEFTPIYQKILADISDTRNIVSKLAPKAK